MRVAIYIRVSTDEQAKEGFSIPAQKNRLMAYCVSQGWEVVNIYIDDGESAKDLKRTRLQKMLSDMEHNLFDVVLVYRLDRLTRSVLDLYTLLQIFEQHNVKFKSATEVYDTTTAMGRLFITLVAALAQWERENLGERVRFGIEQMVLEGKRPGGVLPYGYDKNGNLIKEEAELIREVRKHYMSGLGYKSVAMMMNRQGKLRRGNEWTDATVAYTLENPYYAGIIRLGSKTAEGSYVNHRRDDRVDCIYGEGSHEPVFTKAEYDEHMNMMRRRSTGNGFSRNSIYWFSGVLRCGKCGAAMFGRLTTRRSRKSGQTARTQYYICSNRHHKKTCDMPTFRQVHIENLLMEYIEKTKLDHELVKSESKNITSENKKRIRKIIKLKNDIEKVKERKKKWQYMFVEDLISEDELRQRIREENEMERELTIQLNEMERLSAAVPKINELLELTELWEALDDQEKKEMIYIIFKRIVVYTDLVNPKGVKNKFFDAKLSEVLYN